MSKNPENPSYFSDDENENESSTIFFERDSTGGRKRAKEKQESQLHKAKDLE